MAARGVLPGVLLRALLKAGSLLDCTSCRIRAQGVCQAGVGTRPPGAGGSGAATGCLRLRGAERLWGWSTATSGPLRGSSEAPGPVGTPTVSSKLWSEEPVSHQEATASCLELKAHAAP